MDTPTRNRIIEEIQAALKKAADGLAFLREAACPESKDHNNYKFLRMATLNIAQDFMSTRERLDPPYPLQDHELKEEGQLQAATSESQDKKTESIDGTETAGKLLVTTNQTNGQVFIKQSITGKTKFRYDIFLEPEQAQQLTAIIQRQAPRAT